MWVCRKNRGSLKTFSFPFLFNFWCFWGGGLIQVGIFLGIWSLIERWNVTKNPSNPGWAPLAYPTIYAFVLLHDMMFCRAGLGHLRKSRYTRLHFWYTVPMTIMRSPGPNLITTWHDLFGHLRVFEYLLFWMPRTHKVRQSWNFICRTGCSWLYRFITSRHSVRDRMRSCSHLATVCCWNSSVGLGILHQCQQKMGCSTGFSKHSHVNSRRIVRAFHDWEQGLPRMQAAKNLRPSRLLGVRRWVAKAFLLHENAKRKLRLASGVAKRCGMQKQNPARAIPLKWWSTGRQQHTAPGNMPQHPLYEHQGHHGCHRSYGQLVGLHPQQRKHRTS